MKEQLIDLLMNLSIKCTNDDDFNNWLAEKDIFSRSIDDIISDLIDE